MATKKTITKSSPKKKSPAKKKAKKKNNKKQTSRRFGYSTLIIIVIAVLIFFYMNRNDKVDIMNQIENQQSDHVVQTEVVKEEVTTNGNKALDGEKLSFYYPSSNLSNGGIVEHLAYSLDYNEDYEQSDWIFYELTKNEVINKKVPRKDKFAKDPDTSITSALPDDYYKSGYDRGHLCPAADNRWAQQAMDESFYMSNMSPQDPDLNRKIWADLEEKVREWAIENEKVYVATGPILADGFKKKIGKSGVSVPYYFYKVVADLTGDEIKGVGFIFVNGENNGELKNFAFPIDLIEERTKIDFFPNLDDKIENQIETDFEIEDWFK